MQKLLTLGPSGTFSELAARRYIQTKKITAELVFLPSIKSVFDEISRTGNTGVIPLENFSEGFIALVLDQLIERDLHIEGEIILPINFTFVARSDALEKIDNVYVQFVAKGQCTEFLHSLGHVKTHLTESNTESMQKCIDHGPHSGAIVPSYSVDESAFSLCLNNVNDYRNNQTRFLVLACHKPTSIDQEANRTSILVLDDDDHPGLLAEVLQSFSIRMINLTNIVSRPSLRTFGKYHFFIEFDGTVKDSKVAQALAEISKTNKVKVLGSYRSFNGNGVSAE